MKKTFLTLVITLTLLTFSFAQETKKGFEFSIKGGLTLANQYGEDADSETRLNGSAPNDFYANHPASTKIKTGLNVGGEVAYRFNKRLSLGLGLNYIEKGTNINAISFLNSDTQERETIDGTIKWIQNYWTIDLPFKVYFPLKQNEIHVLGGLSFGRLINSIEKGSFESLGNEYEYTNDRGANENEQGFLLGVGYNLLLPNKKNRITIDFIWNRSFGKSFGADLVPSPQYYYNQTFNMNVGYTFDLKKKQSKS